MNETSLATAMVPFPRAEFQSLSQATGHAVAWCILRGASELNTY